VGQRLYVLVAGPPASGKSTLAPALAAGLELPLIAKDTIKDAIMSVLPVPGVEASRKIGTASVAAMLAVAAESPVGAVIESNFYRSRAVEMLRELPGPVVEVFCRCDRELSVRRYRDRAGTRAAGHFDGVRTDDEIWSPDVGEPVAAGWPVIEVDTSGPVDVDKVIAGIRASVPLDSA
jgi:predicted kinase